MEVTAAPTYKSGRPENAPLPPRASGAPLDAYWASYGTAAERAQERLRVSTRSGVSERVLYEVILGTDDRTMITDTDQYPWRCICSLLITAQNGSGWIGTGWLVGPRLVLTAGHCVYMADEGGWASSIEVIPGRNGQGRPFGSAVATDLRSVVGWTVDNDRNYDYGAIILPEDARYGDQLGWFGYTPRPDDYFSGITLNLSGYPGDGGKTQIEGTQWFHARGIREVFERQISYEIDTFGGQSGGPVFETTSDGSRYGLAIHTWGTSVSNGATRITQDVFDNIIQWAGEAS